MVYVGKFSKAEHARQDDQDRRFQAFDEEIAKAEKHGSARSTGSVVHATFDEFKDTKGYSAHTRPCLRPHYRSDKDGKIVAKVYTHSEFEALKEGWYCVRCDELQREPTVAASRLWTPGGETVRAQCTPMGNGRGCGFPRGTEAWRLLPLEIRVLPKTLPTVATP